MAPIAFAIDALEVRRLLSTWYVATTGASNNNGSLSQPFATIQQAANVAQPGDTVYIMGGTYHETVVPPVSGTAGEPITFEPYQGQTVTIDGADPITGWSADSGSIYQAAQPWDLGEGNNQVFVDGTMVNEARWPSTPADTASTSSTAPANISTPTWATATSVSVTMTTVSAPATVTIYNSQLNQPAGTWVGSIAHIAAGQEWVDQVGTITASSPGSITVSYFQATTYQVPQAGNRFYIVGNMAALDSAGEWYRDPSTGTLYLWDAAGDNPANHVIEAKVRDYGFDLSGLSNIDINDINLFACTINTDANSNSNILNGISAQYVSQSIGITPDTTYPWGAKFHPHTTGIILNGSGNVLENSTVAFSSGDGVFLGGTGNTVENTVIHDVDYEAGDEAGVTSLGTNETILDNTIYNAGRSGIVARFTYDSLISHNVIYAVALQMTDCGGIYTWGTNAAGTEISYNVVYDVHSAGFGAAGIYLDNTSQDFIVDHNVVFDCDTALRLNPPSWDNVIVNNTFVGTQYALGSSGTEDMTGTLLANDIFDGPTMFGTGATLTNNITSPTDPDFVNPSQENYQLQSGSPAINAGAPQTPYSQDFAGSAPDIGAYEYGRTPFRAGAAAQPFIPTAPSGQTIAMTPTTPNITWATPAAIVYGTALSATQLDATSPIPGNFIYTPALGTVLNAGSSRTLSLTFVPLDSIDYNSTTATAAINVARVTPTATWANPTGIVYGTALSSAELDATSSVPGTFTYTPAAGTILSAGSGQTLSATFTPTDSVDYAGTTASATINVSKATPTLRWSNPSSITYGTALSSTQLDSTSSVAGTSAYSPAAGTILHAGNSQTLSVTFTPTDTTDENSTTQSVTINVLPASPSITWTNPAAITFGTHLSVTQLDATSSVAGTLVYSPAAGTALSAGAAQALSVTFTPTDTQDYSGASASAQITVSKALPNLSWNSPSPIVYGTPLSGTQLDATTNVPGTFNYNDPIGSVVTAGAAALTATFTPTDSADYSSSTVNATLTINPATTSTAVTCGTASPVAGQPLTFTATVTSPGGSNATGTVQFKIDGSNAGPAQPLENGIATFTQSSLAAGSYGVVAIYSGDANFNGSTSGVFTQAVALAPVVPVVTTSPTAQNVLAGTSVTFLSAAVGTPSPAVQWQLSTDNGVTWSAMGGATAATYTLVTAVSQNANQYRAVYTNAAGSAATTAAVLHVDQPIKLVFAQQPVAAIATSTPSLAIVVNVEDASNNVVTLDSSNVTLAIASGPAGAILGGTTTLADQNGVATFSDLTFSQAGSYTLTVNDGALSPATSMPIIVSAVSPPPVSPPPVSPPPPSGPELIPAIFATHLPAAPLVAGTTVQAMTQTLRLTNTSSTAISGPATISLLLSSDPTGNSGGTQAASMTEVITNLKPGKFVTVPMQIHSLPTGATGNLYIVSEVTDPSGSTALTASANTLSVAAPFIDLQPLLIRAPAAIKAGKKGPVSVTLINNGNFAANGILSIDLQASTDGAMNSDSIDLGTVVRSILIEPGKKAVLSLRGISFPNTRGSYYIVASIDPSNTFNESTLSDKSLSSATTVRLT